MHLIGIRVSLALALFAAVMGLRSANALDLNQDWVLNSSLSHVYMQTEKLEAVIERQQFKSVEGSVSKDGDVTIKLDLASLETGIDLRNVRMRFLLFEVFKYPFAVITAKLDKSKLQYLTDPKAPVKAYPLTLWATVYCASGAGAWLASRTRTTRLRQTSARHGTGRIYAAIRPPAGR